MQIVIDIPNSLYANISKIQHGSIASKRILDCVREGTPLPKSHGRLIDANKLRISLVENEWISNVDGGGLEDLLDDAPTIIEADKAESDEVEE